MIQLPIIDALLYSYNKKKLTKAVVGYLCTFASIDGYTYFELGRESNKHIFIQDKLIESVGDYGDKLLVIDCFLCRKLSINTTMLNIKEQVLKIYDTEQAALIALDGVLVFHRDKWYDFMSQDADVEAKCERFYTLHSKYWDFKEMTPDEKQELDKLAQYFFPDASYFTPLEVFLQKA